MINVQQTIIKGIKEQLFFNNYLVIPNFGGFVLKSNTAHVSKSGGLIVPPSKTVSFNIQLKQNDGILALWLQNKLSCSSTEAILHLHDFADYCSSILQTRRRFTLEGIGFFYLDFENNICFEPQSDANFLSSSFGLAGISLKELELEITEIKKEPVFVDRVIHPQTLEQSIKPKKNYRKVVLPALFSIIFLSLLLLFVANTNISGKLNASLFAHSSSTTYAPINYCDLKLASHLEDNLPYVADANGIATIEIENNKTIAVKALELPVYSEVVSHSMVSNNVALSHSKFEIVLGCFSVIENANNMLEKLSKQHVNAFLSGKNNRGMYVVSNGAFETKDQAVEQLGKIKSTFPHAWIKAR
jgi:hypothetical protein